MSERSKHLVIAVTNDITHDRRMLRIATSLVSAGYTVSIIGRRLDRNYSLEEPSDVQLIRLRCFINSGPLFYAEYNIRLFIGLLFLKVDIYYAVDLDTLASMSTMAILKGKFLIYDSHEYFTEVPELQGRKMVKRIWTGIGRLFVKRADLRMTVGHELSKVLAHKYGATFKIVRNVPQGFDRREKDEVAAPFKVVYVGVLNEGRGLSVLISAMIEVPDMQLTILGDGILKASLIKLIKDLDLTNRVYMQGMINQEDVIKELTKHHMGVNLLDARSTSYYYSLANKCFDYIQAELPSLHMNFPEYSRLVRDYEIGVLVEELSVGSIVHALNELSDPQKYASVQAKCRSAKQELNWEAEEKRFLDMMSSSK